MFYHDRLMYVEVVASQSLCISDYTVYKLCANELGWTDR